MHIDPKSRKERRFRVNLNYYQAAAIEALATPHRKQAATYLAEIIESHLEQVSATGKDSIDKSA